MEGGRTNIFLIFKIFSDMASHHSHHHHPTGPHHHPSPPPQYYIRKAECVNRLVYDLKNTSTTALALALDSEDGSGCADAADVDLPPSMVLESRTMPVVSLGKGRSCE